MKWLVILCCLPLAGCFKLEAPNLVSDSVKAGKDVYQAVVDRRKKPEPTNASLTLSHSYIGKDSQTIGEIKELCVEEAVQKLQQASGKPVRYIVAQNDVATINATVVANCKLIAENN